MWVIVSAPVAANEIVDVIACDPPDAAFCASAVRVAIPVDTAVVPDAPGSAVWHWTNRVAGAVKVVPLPDPRMVLSHALARLTADSPTVMTSSSHVRWCTAVGIRLCIDQGHRGSLRPRPRWSSTTAWSASRPASGSLWSGCDPNERAGDGAGGRSGRGSA